MWKKIKADLSKLAYFGVVEVAQLGGVEERVARQALWRWGRQGRVVRLKRDVYVLREWYLRYELLPEFEEMVASLVWPKGYVSGEYVLDKAGVLSEPVRVVTGVTSGNGGVVKNRAGKFWFRHLKRELFGGYRRKVIGGVEVRTAGVGKALFDWLYLRRVGGWAWREKDYDVAEDLRLNLGVIGEEERGEFEEWVEKSESGKMKKILASLRRGGW